MQRYLKRWATWWHSVTGLKIPDLILEWCNDARKSEEFLAWLGSGLLIPYPSYLHQYYFLTQLGK